MLRLDPLGRHAKIVCTLGPATFSPAMIEKLILKGMDVARLNFSHGDHATYAEVIAAVRQKSLKLKKPIMIIQDLQGPKIRVGKLLWERILLKKGQRVSVTTRSSSSEKDVIPIPFKPLCRLLKKGNSILIDDGLIELRVTRVGKGSLDCVVVTPGTVRPNKGVNLPYIKTRRGEGLTMKDKTDLAFGIRHGVDFVAMSFVTRPEDIEELRKRIPRTAHIGIIAKIEKLEAITNFNDILEVSDGIMVARGDLAVESSTQVVPCLQKEIIQKCNQQMKPVITATQMLESMVNNPRPTRAEASDVANAVLDGSDAVMLSSETAFGKYPLQSVGMMDTIIREVERHHRIKGASVHLESHLLTTKTRSSKKPIRENVRGVIEKATCHIAEGFNAKLICCLTETGRSALYISNARPRQPIVALTVRHSTLRRLSLVWGVSCYYIKAPLNDANLWSSIRKRLLELRFVKKQDKIVVTTGVFTKSEGTTRITKVHEI